jgi:pyruvate/2-oxoglutarate dehydrogenase complex dihydrolipoamide dehydrogenase (E3) component
MAHAYDLVIVGMGSAGIVAAEFAVSLGLRVAAVERGRVGGDCLWTGCVPSKALLASARVAHAMRTAERYGIGAAEPRIDST